MKQQNTCYMCDAIATSREHVPPVCFFPEQKDIKRDLRKNLITVPSCVTHNSEKSDDDAILCAIVLMIADKSGVAHHLFCDKFLKAVRRKPHVYRQCFTDRGWVNDMQAGAFQIDRERFRICMDRMTRAIFRYEYGWSWPERILMETPKLFTGIIDGRVLVDHNRMTALAGIKILMSVLPEKGCNPEVFFYRSLFDESQQIFALEVCFYESVDVYMFSSRNPLA